MIGEIFLVKYEVTGFLHESPIFMNYSGRDRVLGKEIGLRFFKAPFGDEALFVQSVWNAAQQASIVNHPGVERIEGCEEDSGKTFLIGQFSAGILLSERIRKLAPLSVSVAVGHAVSILEGLAALHSSGIVHGDVSAQNVVIGPDGSARLQMAGIWKAYSQSSTAGMVVLPSMAPYMAPEVGAGQLPSTSSDVYSVGVILYTLLCGRLPYAADTPVAMAIQHATAPTPSVRAYLPTVPVVLEEIIKKALSKDAGNRYGNAGQMLSDLRMQQDALRFGRTLSWPLKRLISTPTPGTVDTKNSGRQGAAFNSGPAKSSAQKSTQGSQFVAPRMSEARSVSKKTIGETRDVPTWLLMAIAGLVGVVGMGAFTFWAYFNINKQRMVIIPNLEGRDVAQARSALQGLHLQMKEVDQRTDDHVPAQAIIQSDPLPGDSIREGGIVNVVVSSGGKKVQTPDLRGMTLDAARTVLKADNLGLSSPILQVASSSFPKDEIVTQNPMPDKTIDKQTMISVSVSSGPPDTVANNPTQPSTNPNPPDTSSNPDVAPPPDSSKATVYNLSITLSDVSHAVMLRVDMKDVRGTQTILSEPHDAKDTVPIQAVGYGPTATFRIYYDDALVKTIVEKAKGGG